MIRDAWLRLVLRPLGRRLGTARWEPHFAAPQRCLRCGYEGMAVIACSTPLYDPESDAIYGMQCPDCGEMACTTLGVADGLTRTDTDPWPRITRG
jgi:predicted RNA-binding Zn-ribbon protein involved in translation (DUF1610 family)